MSDVPPIPTDDAEPPPAPRPSRGATVAWATGIAAAVVLAAGIAFLAGRQSADTAADDTTTTTAQPGVTAGPGWSRSDAEIVGAMAVALEQSSAAKALSTSTMLAVERCTIPLDEAAAQLDTVIAERRATIDDVEALDASGGLAVAAENLVEALEFSLLADEARQRWVDWLAVEWSATYTGGCWPAGQIPTDANLEVAQVEAANGAAMRTEFITLFNPLATAAGLRTWDATEF